MPTAWSYVWPCPSPRSETWLERELSPDELRQIGKTDSLRRHLAAPTWYSVPPRRCPSCGGDIVRMHEQVGCGRCGQWRSTQEPPASPADSGRLEMNPTHLPTRGDHGPDQEPAISPERR